MTIEVRVSGQPASAAASGAEMASRPFDERQTMRFWVIRTSRPRSDQPPIPEATRYERGWGIDIETIDQLVAILEREGEIVLVPPSRAGDRPGLEIYDAWRE